MRRGRATAGLLNIRVIRGRNLAMRDVRGSDPYVILSTRNKRVKSRVIKKDVNPEWNEDLSLYVQDTTDPVRLEVFDKDTFSQDDPMGRADVDIGPLIEATVAARRGGVDPSGVIRVVTPESNSALVSESKIRLCNGKVIQDMILRLRDVECGEVELQLEWIDTGRAW
ncbi:unnamed protein product [Spirodela intermedia]|uniref:C2 domain-containing protein n=1 Tax=Spirodela intermedia TaxID=51605 RepID=A0A7I8KWB7_SPIIN|nr:unnamed protein product [Spirodela intermedia]